MGFDGVVVSDWGGVKDRIKALEAGNDLDMPENRRNNQSIIDAVRNGILSESVLDQSVERILELVFKAKEQERFTDKLILRTTGIYREKWRKNLLCF